MANPTDHNWQQTSKISVQMSPIGTFKIISPLLGNPLFTCRCRLFRTQRKCPFIDNRFSAVVVKAFDKIKYKNADTDNINYSPKPLNCDRQILPPTIPKMFFGIWISRIDVNHCIEPPRHFLINFWNFLCAKKMIFWIFWILEELIM